MHIGRRYGGEMEIFMQKRSFREWVKYTFIWLFFFWVSALCAVAIDLMVMKIIGTIVVIPFEVEVILHIATMLVGAGIPIGAISYLISFHLADFSLLSSSVEGVTASLLHFPLGMLLGFPIWITGGVKWLAALLEYGSRLYHADAMKDVALRYYALAFLIFTVFFLLVKTAFGILGKKLRIRQRDALMASCKKQ